ncbi:MAG: cytochrome c [Deltaproteobacteria bacterium]|nr:cytochrome c [Deltaproteobacteria bacterium]
MPWSWDMFSQPSHKAQEDIAPATPEGIVPASGVTFVRERADAGKLANPFNEATDDSVKRGKNRYGIYCATCHGDTGHGDGPVGQKYITPTDLTTDYIRTKPDGDIFYTITYGGLAIMPSYGESVAPEDRWHIVNYIKHSLAKQGVKEVSAP